MIGTILERAGRHSAAGFAALALAWLAGTSLLPAVVGSPMGTGWLEIMTCLTCLVGTFTILGSGMGAIYAALSFPGGALIAAGCVRACYLAIA